MTVKKVVVSLFCSILVLGVGFFYITENKTAEFKKSEDSLNKTPVSSAVLKVPEKKFDLYAETPYDIPLLSIYEISKMPSHIKNTVDEILELSQGFYILKEANDRILVLLQNPVLESKTYSRHDLQYVEIYPDGRKVFHNAGYAGIEGEISNSVEQIEDDWIFDKSTEPYRPLKHIVRDDKGKVSFTEIWNYDSNENIKYQMKDSRNKVVSMLKEIQEGESNYRREHIFYDNDGKTAMSITINYDGANISRFTYYNAHDTIDSISIISEYTDGLKTRELVYDEDYQLVNTYESIYTDGIRKGLRVLDADGNEIAKL